MSRETCKELARRDRLPDGLEGLAAAAAAGLAPVKVNAVLMRGVNDHEAPGLLRFYMDHGYQLRFIEQMPLDAQYGWRHTDMVTVGEILLPGLRRAGGPARCSRERVAAGHRPDLHHPLRRPGDYADLAAGAAGFGTFINVRRAALTSAVVGRVGRPVSGRGSLPGDSDADVDAKQSGQQGCGEFGGEAEQRGRACRAGTEPVLAHSLGEAAGADRPAGLPAGEQPTGAYLVAQCGVSASGGDELEDERIKWLGQHDGLAAQPEPHVPLARVDMVEG